MASLSPYLQFQGNCEEAFNFYKSAFGKDFQMISRYGDMPPGEKDNPGMKADPNKIMHVALQLTDESWLMGSDWPEGIGPLTIGQNVQISVDTASKDEADKLFGKLSAGGNVHMPLADTFWGSYFGMFVDKFGVNWMVSYNEKR